MIDSSGTPLPPDSSDKVTTSIAASLTGRRQRLEQSPSYQGTTFMITCHVPLWQLFVKASQGWKRAFLADNC